MSEILQEHLEIELENGLNKVYIKDENGLIRFIVSLVHVEQSEQWDENGWLVKVQQTKDDRELFELSRQFYKETEREKAQRTMHNLVRDYQVLSRLQCEKVDPRLVFNDTVNYRKIYPDRCGNCVFCVFHDIGCGEEKDIRLFCSNKKNLRNNEYMNELMGRYARFSQITNIQDMIEVDGDCVCDNYHGATEEK